MTLCRTKTAFPPPKRRWMPTLLVCAVLLSSACSDDANLTFVDFSQRTALACPAGGRSKNRCFKVAVGSMISARETAVQYHQLLDFIAGKLGRKIQLIQRKTYGETNALIQSGQIDLAFICSGPYVIGKEAFGFEALAIPVVHGSHFYTSYLIVNKKSPFHSLDDLKGKTFAFTDPDSNTGRMVPVYWLAQRGKKPERFFGKTLYTYSHDNSIMAVAMGLVEGAAVNQLIWEFYNHTNPIYTSRTRIIKKSKPFGNPPVVASARLSAREKQRIRHILLNMHNDPAGRKILAKLMIDRFVTPQEAWYTPIVSMQQSLAASHGAS